MPVTPLLGIRFGELPGQISGFQRKLTLPYGISSFFDHPAAVKARAWQPSGEQPPIDFGIPEVPVAALPIPEIYGAESGVRPVLAGPVGVWNAEVPAPVVVVTDEGHRIEEHPEGDFPAGSIFAPGQAWGDSVGGHGLDEELQEEEDAMAHDWGHLIRQIGGEFLGVSEPSFAPLGINPATSIPSGMPATLPSSAPVQYVSGGGGMNDCGNRRYVTLDRTTGKITCKRRRRRRLLTDRDLSDLASLKSITGGGAALNAAVIKAVR